MTTEHTQTTCDTSGMIVIHRVLRTRFALMPGLVRAVPAGDTNRARVVAAHVDEFADLLHTHHETEDTHLWDVLETRSPGCAMHVALMRAQHGRVAELLARVRALLEQWVRAADATVRDRLADTLDDVATALGTHLGDEEDRMLPVAATTMSQKEWDAFGDLGRKSVPASRLLVQLGYVLDTIRPADRAAWTRTNLPAPVRGLYRLVGRRRFVSDYRNVFGVDPA
jgi:hemerythrin-like domain-containing protein